MNHLEKYCDARSSIKLLNIYTLNNQLDALSFNFKEIFKYRFNFLIAVCIFDRVLKFNTFNLINYW